MNPISGNTVQVINLDQNDAAMSIALCKFPHMDPSSTFCLVGVAKDYQLSPRTVGGGSIHVYRIVHGGQGLELIHRTAVDEVPYAICPFQNKVLIGRSGSQIKLHARNTILCAGVGKLLRLYDLGRKKLLRKCENKHIPHLVVDIKTVGERIICSDVQVIRTKRIEKLSKIMNLNPSSRNLFTL